MDACLKFRSSVHAALVVVGIVLCCALSADAAAFSVPQVVSGSDNAVNGPAVAADSASSRIVAWRRAADSHVVVRRVHDSGQLDAVLDVSSESSKSANLPVVATADVSGNVTVAWTRASDSHVVAVRIPSGGAPGSPVDVSQASVASSSQIGAAADGLGNVHLVWRNGSNSHVTTRSLAPDGGVGGVTDISVNDAEAALWGTAPAVAADSLGTAYFTYHRNTDCHIMLRSLSTGGIVGPAIDVTQTEHKAVGDTSPSVTTSGPNVLVVWHRDGDIYNHADDTVYSSLVSGGVTPGTPVQLSPVGDVSMMNIGAAGGPDGAFGVTWQGRTSGAVNYRKLDSGGQPAGDVQPLLAAGSAAGAAPALAIGPTAGDSVGWTAANGEISLVSSTGTWTPPVPVSVNKPKVMLAKGSPKLRGGKVRLRVSCSGADCRGKLYLKDRAGKRAWGGAKFSLSVGATKFVTVKLNRKARKILRRAKVVKARVEFVVNGGAKSTAPLKLRR